MVGLEILGMFSDPVPQNTEHSQRGNIACDGAFSFGCVFEVVTLAVGWAQIRWVAGTSGGDRKSYRSTG